MKTRNKIYAAVAILAVLILNPYSLTTISDFKTSLGPAHIVSVIDYNNIENKTIERRDGSEFSIDLELTGDEQVRGRTLTRRGFMYVQELMARVRAAIHGDREQQAANIYRPRLKFLHARTPTSQSRDLTLTRDPLGDIVAARESTGRPIHQCSRRGEPYPCNYL